MIEVEDVNQPAADNRWAKLKLDLRNHLGWAVSLFLVGLGAKLWLLGRCANPFPYLDQWSAEAAKLFIPYFQGQLSLATLFSAHNEHRILWTRLCDLGLLLLNKQWDSRLEMVVNAIIHCATLGGLGWAMARLFGQKYWPLIWAPLALVLGLPFDWGNTLSGFQLQFYCLLLFSFLALWLTLLHKPFSSGWNCGILAAIAVLFSGASGLLTAATLVVVLLLDVFKSRKNLMLLLPSLVCFTLIAAWGFYLKPVIPRHQMFQAHSIFEFLTALGSNLAWPWIFMPVFSILNLLPIALLAYQYHVSERPRPAERFVLGLGVWVIFQGIATAYARGADGRPPDSRYMDSSSLIFVTDCLAILLVLKRGALPLLRPRQWHLVFSVCVINWLLGLGILNYLAWTREIPERVYQQQKQLANTRAYLATGDLHFLLQKPELEVPYPRISELAKWLNDPNIRSILPACARDPLPVRPAPELSTGFIVNGCPAVLTNSPADRCWGSLLMDGNAGPARFESVPIKSATLPYLEIPVAGAFGSPGLSLELVQLSRDKSLPLSLPPAATGRWERAYIRAPRGEFKFVAQDNNKNEWLAFQPPRELGRLSYWSIQLLAAWKYILSAGVVCLALSGLETFRTRQSPTRQSVDTPSPKPSHAA